MRRAVCRGLAVLLASLTMSLPAVAQSIEPGKEGELATLVKPQKGARACFGRSYDAKHMQSHPEQRVARMDFRLAYHIHEPDQFFPKGQRNYYFDLKVRLRGQSSSRPLTASGECSVSANGKRIFCGVECDGGGIVIRARDGDKLLVDLGAVGSIRMTEGCDANEEDGVDLLPGKDDRTFLLGRASECAAYENW